LNYPEEALENVKDALLAVIEAYEDLHRPLPSILQRLALDLETPFLVEAVVPAWSIGKSPANCRPWDVKNFLPATQRFTSVP